jgi:uncharacterized membrane protein
LHSNPLPAPSSLARPALGYAATVFLIALIALGLAWELWLAPLRPGGSWLVLKIVPLLFALIGVLKHRLYTLQWAALLMMVYLTEGIVRVGDKGLSSYLAMLEIALSMGFFTCSIAYVRPFKRAARAQREAGEGV